MPFDSRKEGSTNFARPCLERLVVGDDAVVHDEELVGGVAGVRVAVVRRGAPVRRPPRVPDPAVVLQVHLRVQPLLGGTLLSSGSRVMAERQKRTGRERARRAWGGGWCALNAVRC